MAEWARTERTHRIDIPWRTVLVLLVLGLLFSPTVHDIVFKLWG